jgi:hypothetical protein
MLARIMLALLTPMAEAFKEDHAHKEDFWENELRTLCIAP